MQFFNVNFRRRHHRLHHRLHPHPHVQLLPSNAFAYFWCTIQFLNFKNIIYIKYLLSMYDVTHFLRFLFDPSLPPCYPFFTFFTFSQILQSISRNFVYFWKLIFHELFWVIFFLKYCMICYILHSS